ncbi:MAG: FIST N-terminal domain-containing protein [Gemmataceae bacterium]
MPFFSYLSTLIRTDDALREIVELASGVGPIDMACVFFSGEHAPEAADIVERLHETLAPKTLIGCSGESIVGNESEVEGRPALAVWLARFPAEVQLTPFHLTVEPTGDGYTILGWPDELDDADPRSTIFLLGEPFTFPTEDAFRNLDDIKAGLRVVGGMASAGREPGVNRLLIGDKVVGDGAVGVLAQGPLRVRTIVSQGCRPIGKPYVVTKAQRNRILELGGKPALPQLQELWQELSPADQKLVQQGLHLGRVVNEYQETFRRGDFLVRNVMGIERESGSVIVGDQVRVGQTVQFHVRDAAAADEDLRLLLQASSIAEEGKAAGGLLFTCNGRGKRLFGEPNHDAAAIRTEFGPIPVAGFFAMGELGPIGGRNFIHGFTASAVLFDE